MGMKTDLLVPGNLVFHDHDGEYVKIAGDTMTGTLNINVATATESALVLKTTDDDSTNPLLRVLDPSSAITTRIDQLGFYRHGIVGDDIGEISDITTDGGLFVLGRDDSNMRIGERVGEIQFWGNDTELDTAVKRVLAQIRVEVEDTAINSGSSGVKMLFGFSDAAPTGITNYVTFAASGQIGVGNTDPYGALSVGADATATVTDGSESTALNTSFITRVSSANNQYVAGIENTRASGGGNVLLLKGGRNATDYVLKGVSEDFQAYDLFSFDAVGNNIFYGGATTSINLTLRAAASQTANIQEWQDSTSTALSYVDEDGRHIFSDGALGAPGFGFLTDPSAGVYYKTSTGEVTFSKSGTDYMAYANAAFTYKVRSVFSLGAYNGTNPPFFIFTRFSPSFPSNFSYHLEFRDQTNQHRGGILATNDEDYIWSMRGYWTNGQNIATKSPIRAVAASGQSAPIQTWEDNSNNVLVEVGASGTLQTSKDRVISTETSTGTATMSDDVEEHRCNSASPYTLTLYAHKAGKKTTVVNDGAGAVTLSPVSGTIFGSANFVLNSGDAVIFGSDGTNYILRG